MKEESGMTLIELTIGLAILLLIGGVVTGLLSAGVRSFNYTLRQTLVLASARKALEGDGPWQGLIKGTRSAGSTLDTPALPETLTRHTGSPKIHYYQLNSLGTVVESVRVSSATLVTAMIQIQNPRRKTTSSFFSGAQLRNHPE